MPSASVRTARVEAASADMRSGRGEARGRVRRADRTEGSEGREHSGRQVSVETRKALGAAVTKAVEVMAGGWMRCGSGSGSRSGKVGEMWALVLEEGERAAGKIVLCWRRTCVVCEQWRSAKCEAHAASGNWRAAAREESIDI